MNGSSSAPGDVRLVSALSGLGRIAIGVGLAVAPGRALAALGFRSPRPDTVTVARIAGGRDIVLGIVTLAALGDRDRLLAANLANAGVDAGDALICASDLTGRSHGNREAAARGFGAAVPAALAGLWAAARLARR